jgi:hypothetical protein
MKTFLEFLEEKNFFVEAKKKQECNEKKAVTEKKVTDKNKKHE